ncbi:MAG: aminopeptidase P family protein [Acholeplasmataceae bacterium]
MVLKRRKEYLKLINPQSISIFYSGKAPHLSADSYYPFYVNKNFWYLSGINQEDTYLVIVKGDLNYDTFLFTKKPDPLLALWVGESLSFEEAAKISNIKYENIFDISEFENFVTNLLTSSRRSSFGSIYELYFDFDRFSFKDLPKENELLANDFKDKFPYLKISNSHPSLVNLRKTKDELEIKSIKEAIAISNLANTHLLNTLKNALNESDVLAEFLYILNKKNVIPSFDPIVAGGINATILHYTDNNQPLNKDDLILLDLGVKYNEYASDITRTYPLSGKFTKRQKEVYEAVLSVNKDIINWVKPGITLKEYNDKGKELLIKYAKEINLIKHDDEISKYYYHSLGHPLGLDVHDVVNPLMPLKEGDVITVEPGLYIKEEGIGVRIEDDLLITKDGVINLSKEIIKEVDDIERLLK